MLNNIFNFSCALFVLIFTILSIIKTGKALSSDKKTTFLGFASTYIFNYFSFCLVILLMIFFSIGFIILKRPLDYKTILLVYCSHTYCIYNCSIFLIKKYNFTNIKNELIITSLLQLFCFINIVFACSCPYFRYSNIRALTFDSYPEMVYFILTGLGNYAIFYESNDLIYALLSYLKLFPLFILGAMWVNSIGKKYNYKSHSYFVKSANHSIFFFLLYESLLVSLSYYDYRNNVELSIYLIFIFILKFIFSRKILFWLRHKDMEEIETNAILRSKRNVKLDN